MDIGSRNRGQFIGLERAKTGFSRWVARPEAYRIAQDHPHLNRARKDLIEEVLSSTDRVQGLQGFAGSVPSTVCS